MFGRRVSVGGLKLRGFEIKVAFGWRPGPNYEHRHRVPDLCKRFNRRQPDLCKHLNQNAPNLHNQLNQNANQQPVDPIQLRVIQLEDKFRKYQDGEYGKLPGYDSDEETEPFHPVILNSEFPRGFKNLHVLHLQYDGTTYLIAHLNNFNTTMRASNVSNNLRCILFPTSLTRAASSWFDKFTNHSITSWEQLLEDFKNQFQAARDR
uniref:Retrotransposon gag domain-containing protein n=1 Tax=Cannabis sativa TaxID=3483 RepID=A0A803PK54_CANSA